MLLFDARQVRVAVGADDLARLMDAEDVRQAEVGAAFVVLVKHAGLEGGQQRASAVYISAQLPALPVAEQGRVGKQQCRILLQILRRHFLFVHEIEEKAAFQQGVVHAVHILRHGRAAWRFIE